MNPAGSGVKAVWSQRWLLCFALCLYFSYGYSFFLLSFFSLSVTFDSVTPWTVARQASLFFTIFRNVLKLVSIESVMPSNHLILCRPLLLLPSIFPSIRVFSNESALCMRWPKYWSFSFSISPSSEYSVSIFFRVDWFDLHATVSTGAKQWKIKQFLACYI